MDLLTDALVRSQRPLRAVVEIVDGELRIFPVAGTDADERRILDALKFVRQDFEK